MQAISGQLNERLGDKRVVTSTSAEIPGLLVTQLLQAATTGLARQKPHKEKKFAPASGLRAVPVAGAFGSSGRLNRLDEHVSRHHQYG